MKHEIAAADILPIEAYERVREEKRRVIRDIKANRRVAVGPYATFYFENYDTLWLQVQEMLRIEKGGAAQLADELEAYNPMVPKGNELTATMMFEIENPERRRQVLAQLGGVERMMELRCGGEAVKGEIQQDLEYTTPDGKVSAVLFLHFRFASGQAEKFFAPGAEIAVAVTHPEYSHIAIVPAAVKAELAKDIG
ncbi:MAG: DUF3501 family protein [Rhodomicrobium sp.]